MLLFLKILLFWKERETEREITRISKYVVGDADPDDKYVVFAHLLVVNC